MSNYDPFQLYTRRQKSTHQGQVIRKKIPKYYGRCYTNEELEEAIAGLKARGYRIFNPGQPISVSQEMTRAFVYPHITASSFTINRNETFDIKFHNFWPNIKTDFSDILRIDNLRVSNLYFEVSLVSLIIRGFTKSNPDAPLSLRIQTSSLGDTKPFTVYEETGADTYLEYVSYLNDRMFIIKNLGADIIDYDLPFMNDNPTPFLNYVSRQQVAILTALRDNDYLVFDPQIFAIKEDDTQPSITIGNVILCIFVKLHIKFQ